MNTRRRIQLSFVLSAFVAIPIPSAIYGTVVWWRDYGIAYRVLSILTCLILAAALVVAISVGVRQTTKVPWLKLIVVLGSLPLTCGITVLRESIL